MFDPTRVGIEHARLSDLLVHGVHEAADPYSTRPEPRTTSTSP